MFVISFKGDVFMLFIAKCGLLKKFSLSKENLN